MKKNCFINLVGLLFLLCACAHMVSPVGKVNEMPSYMGQASPGDSCIAILGPSPFRSLPGVDLDSFKRDIPIINAGDFDGEQKSLESGVHNTTIVLPFFEIFDDTVIVYKNQEKLAEMRIYTNENPYISTGYSYKDVVAADLCVTDVITICLKSQRRYIQFVPDLRLPLCSIQRYNQKWYISPRASMTLK
ncbi:hypothetical protein ACE38W_12735 [Chitinophaga sp. Hz27]|uniref:hypothetical protein n=1 Tax=Chitinophaga sp. Hz27 TaxID=3347169 RepID=UPI0035D5B197